MGSEQWLGTSDEEFDRLLAERIKKSPGVPTEELAQKLAAELTGARGEGAAAAPSGPPADHPDARQAPDGFWYVPPGDGKWKRVG